MLYYVNSDEVIACVGNLEHSRLFTAFAAGFFTLFMGGTSDHFGARHPTPDDMAYCLPCEEGIWGEPYAVRLEVTFTPDGFKEKRLLASKIYKLEGWMR